MEKQVLLEESVRIRLIMSYPGKLPQGIFVDELVSHLDVVPTIVDYLLDGIADDTEPQSSVNQLLEQFDGTSLRRFVEKRSFNDQYGEDVVVSEFDQRYLTNGGTTLYRPTLANL